jgi:preprotein translocase subunit SecB
MADETNAGAGAADNQTTQAQVQVLGQHIKDLSFENPNVGKLQIQQGENPAVQLEGNVEAQRLGPDVFESSIAFTATASHSGGTIYVLELNYGGAFRLQNIPPQALEPFLLVNCPAMLFPFLRRIVADITRDGGYPPLWLDPFDFGALYLRRQQEMAKNAEKQ